MHSAGGAGRDGARTAVTPVSTRSAWDPGARPQGGFPEAEVAERGVKAVCAPEGAGTVPRSPPDVCKGPEEERAGPTQHGRSAGVGGRGWRGSGAWRDAGVDKGDPPAAISHVTATPRASAGPARPARPPSAGAVRQVGFR